MLFDYSQYSFYMCIEPIDMRSGARCLSQLVYTRLELDPFEKIVFIFTGKARNNIKLLVWNGNGFWLHNKKLYKGTFCWPKDENEARKLVTEEDVIGMLNGQDRWRKLPIL